MTDSYVIVNDDGTALDAALKCCRGCYQRALVMGYEAISGSTLKGKARRYSGRYAQSASNLFRRIRDAGVPVGETRGSHNRRVIVLGIGCQAEE